MTRRICIYTVGADIAPGAIIHVIKHNLLKWQNKIAHSFNVCYCFSVGQKTIRLHWRFLTWSRVTNRRAVCLKHSQSLYNLINWQPSWAVRQCELQASLTQSTGITLCGIPVIRVWFTKVAGDYIISKGGCPVGPLSQVIRSRKVAV